jgi:LPS-assembly protein
MSRLLFTLLLTLGLALPLHAQSIGTASLKADRITYVSGYRILRAKGNVEIIFGTSILTASELVYDAQNNLIEAIGPIRLREGDSLTIVADFASLSSDLREGVLKSARLMLNEQLQIAAVEIKRSEGRYTEMFKAVASTCSVSLAKPTPFWQIRAKRIIQDEVKKELLFEGAQLRILAVPVAYIPRLKLPDPSVKRATGFLVPGVSNSDTRGVSVTAPYFITLGDYADVTLTPTIYSSGTATLGFDLRKRFARGALNVQGSVSRDNQSAGALRAYLFADGQWTSRRGIKTEIQVQTASDTSYLSNFSISGQSRLESYARVNRTTRQRYFGLGVTGYRTFTSTKPDDEIPYLLGAANFRQRWVNGPFGRQAGLTLAVNSFERASTANAAGRDGLRLRSSLDWQRQWIGASGLIMATTTRLDVDYYAIRQDAAYATPVMRTTPIAAFDMRLPLSRTSAKATSVIEPRLQIVWSNPAGGTVPDDDSTQVEFDAQSLFSLNRFAGSDRVETGLRANIGVTYSRRAVSGASLDAVIGKVIRLNDLGQFTAASGLSGARSSYVVAGQLILPSKMRLVQRMVVDDGFTVSRNETSLGYKSEKFDIDTTYLWLLKDAAGNSVDRQEWLMDAGLNLADNWRTEAKYRYDLQTSAPSDAGLALTYRNDCIKVDFSLSRSFISSSNVAASTNVGLQVTLEGFGARLNGIGSTSGCSDY